MLKKFLLASTLLFLLEELPRINVRNTEVVRISEVLKVLKESKTKVQRAKLAIKLYHLSRNTTAESANTAVHITLRLEESCYMGMQQSAILKNCHSLLSEIS